MAEHLQEILSGPLGKEAQVPFSRTDGGGLALADQRELSQTIASVLLQHAQGKAPWCLRWGPANRRFVNGLADITVGAIVGGPVGAISGFVLGVVNLAVSC